MKADIDNGYTRIANGLMEKLSGYDLNGRQFRILVAIMRRTYGYQKVSDWISLNELSEVTGISRKHISAIIVDLVKANIITKAGDNYVKKLGVNPVLNSWNLEINKSKLSPNKGTVIPENGDGHPQIQGQVSPNKGTSIPKLGDGLEITQEKLSPNLGILSPNKGTDIPEKGENYPQIRGPLINKKENKENINKKNKREKTLKKKTTRKKPPDELNLSIVPEHLPKDKILEFVEFRHEKFRLEKKNPFTQLALKSLISKLSGFHDLGYDVIDILDTSIIGGWTGVFEPKGNLKSTGVNHATSQSDYRSQQREVEAAIDDIDDRSWATDD